MEYKKLYRSNQNRILAGVCGGIGEYLNVDPTLVRIIAILLAGGGIVGYLICALIIPARPMG